MNDNRIAKLLGINKKCQCGLWHGCGIDTVLIEEDAINRLPELVKRWGYRSAAVVSDNRTYLTCGKSVGRLLSGELDSVNEIVLKREGVLVPDEKAVGEILAKIKPDTDIIIGAGAGVINDLCKFVSFRMGLAYLIVASAPSMDGYASAGAALIIDNMKITYQTHAPKAIIADTKIIKDAPLEMIAAGLGDMVGKYSAINDWKIAHIITGEVYCGFVAGLVEEALQRCINHAEGIIKREPDAVRELFEGLVIVGIAMSFMDNSRPASGSEHHLSHFYEVIGIMENKPYFLHGIDVFYSTVITSRLRHMLAEFDTGRFCGQFADGLKEDDIKKVYKDAAEGVIKLQNRLRFYSEDTKKKNFESISVNWDRLQQALKEVPKKEELLELLAAAGLCMQDFYKEYGFDTIKNSILYSKDLKDRYTVLWLLSDIGLLEDLAENIIREERDNV